MSYWRFEAEDFCPDGSAHPTRAAAARIANAKIKEWIEAAPVVYGWKNPRCDWMHILNPGDLKHTHKARLICFEPIKQETTEDLLRELLKQYDDRAGSTGCIINLHELMNRARKILERK